MQQNRIAAPVWMAAALCSLLATLTLIRIWTTEGGDVAVPWPDRSAEMVALMDGTAGTASQTAGISAQRSDKPAGIAAPAAAEPVKVPSQSAEKPAEPAAGAERSGSQQRESTGKIDLNRASAAELEKLPGIGPSKAKAIVEYRANSGPFRSPEDIMKVKGIGPKTYESIKDLIEVGPGP